VGVKTGLHQEPRELDVVLASLMIFSRFLPQATLDAGICCDV